MKKIELECPMCGNQCNGEKLHGYPEYVTIECDRDGFQAHKIRSDW